jgi:hypothetical protein
MNKTPEKMSLMLENKHVNEPALSLKCKVKAVLFKWLHVEDLTPCHLSHADTCIHNNMVWDMLLIRYLYSSLSSPIHTSSGISECICLSMVRHI